MAIKITPIGFVKNAFKEPGKGDWETLISEIVINKEFEQALDQIDGFSHIIVLYWMNRVSPTQRTVLKVHPKHDPKMPLVGVLATRSPARPNPIGIATVKLVECHSNILKVMGLDAIDETPVLDIKPHIPRYDSPAETKTAIWATR